MIETFPTADALADAVARHVADCAKEAIAARGRFTVALSGGSTPRAAYSRLATLASPLSTFDSRLSTSDSGLSTLDSRLSSPDWKLFHITWGDERCVPPDDPESNYRMAKEALLDRVPIPPENIHRIRGEDDPEKTAANYEEELRVLLGCHPERQRRVTRGATDTLDLVLLGLGEDGHTASLFPGQPAVHETERWVTTALAPDKKLWRVTLTPPILNAARNVTFMVAGASKAARLQQVLEGPFTPDLLPAQTIRPTHGQLTWMLDEAAASGMKRREMERR